MALRRKEFSSLLREAPIRHPAANVLRFVGWPPICGSKIALRRVECSAGVPPAAAFGGEMTFAGETWLRRVWIEYRLEMGALLRALELGGILFARCIE